MTTSDQSLVDALVKRIKSMFVSNPQGEIGPSDEPDSQYRFGYNTALEDVLAALGEHQVEPASATQWRCFHCGEVFDERDAAALHFGTTERQVPACTIDVAEYRAMEQRMSRYNEEDTDLHREIYTLQARHQSALRREEEKGYARGLADGAAHVQPDLDPAPDGWVLVPKDRAAPTPDYDECARQATLASGLPSLRHAPWMSTFIREINRWCQHRYSNTIGGLAGLVGGWNQIGGTLYRADHEGGGNRDEIRISVAEGSRDERVLAARAAELREQLNRIGPVEPMTELVAELEWCIAEGSGGLRTRAALLQARTALQGCSFVPTKMPR
ncbi:hypothetical protein LA345_36470 (plasmid) [Burkholderia vietnamiensis]|uniref:Uncharacterized protein n=1 Tax=Burkholderia vietnamiensis (strain G4 / LMG 22486) TaxID=269482 RepID=A4JVR8_BURVG|nr:hypothetical protein Bcep1808_7496 [Burkholderia vietnamiensis G4]MCB4349307.1 hypothetical protein [Burkholderia vietnamiensis]